jgi:hypothetical protein
VVQETLHFRQRHAAMAQQVQQYARIQRAGAGPIHSPSNVENPIVESTLRPASRAQRLAPLPRWATTTLPSAISGATLGSTEAMYAYEIP